LFPPSHLIEKRVLENKFLRAGVFFVVAFSISVALAAFFGDVNKDIQIGMVMGIIFAVMSQFFEPKTGSEE